jgi:hypothetical protein
LFHIFGCHFLPYILYMVGSTIVLFAIGFLQSSFHLLPKITQAHLMTLCPMLYFLISCVSFILLSKSFTNNPLPLPPWESEITEMKLLSIWFWGELSSFLVFWMKESKLAMTFFQVARFMPLKKMSLSSKVENVEEKYDTSLLDLPNLALECILDRLSPARLCSMEAVCTSLRDKCRSDHLWEKHIKNKWGRVIGDAAYREWQQWHAVASRKGPTLLDRSKKKGLFDFLFGVCPFPWFRPNSERINKSRGSLPIDSIMGWYLSLENGKFWFPAQVYNREVSGCNKLIPVLFFFL